MRLGLKCRALFSSIVVFAEDSSSGGHRNRSTERSRNVQFNSDPDLFRAQRLTESGENHPVISCRLPVWGGVAALKRFETNLLPCRQARQYLRVP